MNLDKNLRNQFKSDAEDTVNHHQNRIRRNVHRQTQKKSNFGDKFRPLKTNSIKKSNTQNSKLLELNSSIYSGNSSMPGLLPKSKFQSQALLYFSAYSGKCRSLARCQRGSGFFSYPVNSSFPNV